MFRIFCKSLQIHPLDEPARNIWQLYADGDELKDSYRFHAVGDELKDSYRFHAVGI